MKKVFAILLSVLLVCALATATFAAFEGSSCALTAAKTEVKQGETFTVTATLKNEEAINLGAVVMQFDDAVLELTEVKCLVAGAQFTEDSENFAEDNIFTGVDLSGNAAAFMLGSAKKVSGEIFAFTFKVKDTAAVGSTSIKNTAAVGNGTGNAIATTGVSVKITCKEHNFVKGICTECETLSFPDVKQNAWYFNAVKFAVKKGYFSGNGDGTFGPGNDITRQDFVVVLSRIAKADLSKYSGKTSFKDVSANAYYAKAIQWASETGVVSGYNENEFGVGDKLTREQLVTILYRYAAKKGVDVTVTEEAKAKLNAYSDANKVNPYMRNMVAWALQNKVISGMNATTVGPQGTATRAQVAAILFNISSYNVIPF